MFVALPSEAAYGRGIFIVLSNRTRSDILGCNLIIIVSGCIIHSRLSKNTFHAKVNAGSGCAVMTAV